MPAIAFVLSCLGLLSGISSTSATSWFVPDWHGAEPEYSPGSLFWKTREYRSAPIVYRTRLDVEHREVELAGVCLNTSQYAYLFLNGKEIARQESRGDSSECQLTAEFGHLLQPGTNVLVTSVPSTGFAFRGMIRYHGGDTLSFGESSANWHVQKLPPLTMLEFEPWMQPEFDDSDWFPVAATIRESPALTGTAFAEALLRQKQDRLSKLDTDASWRLHMLADKGIVIRKWRAFGWSGAGRLPDWIRHLATQPPKLNAPPGWNHIRAEALTGYIALRDAATNFANHAVGFQALGDQRGAERYAGATRSLQERLPAIESALREGDYAVANTLVREAEPICQNVTQTGVVNQLCTNFNNKFGWFDTLALLDNDIAGWGVEITSPVERLASPLSPATLLSLRNRELTLRGWANLKPLRVYHKPANVGPVGLWGGQNGRVVHLQPQETGVVYDRATHGDLDENWMLLVHDLASGGHLPIEWVFLDPPTQVAFTRGEQCVESVTITFETPGARLFMLRPLQEWRGLLHQARVMIATPIDERAAHAIIEMCRLWSRALLCYPVTYSESFLTDPEDPHALLVADVFNYRVFEDAWKTAPLKLAPLPPLASYGLMVGYPGLKVLSDAEMLGSRGVWGDHIAAVGTDTIRYRVPLDPIKRFGGFTSYCFGPTDIGEPGSLTEIKNLVRAGVNSFRPQHNQTGDRAMRTLQWTWEHGLQHVFNTDEKWVPDIVVHFRTLAEQCKDYPPDAVAYDLLNEPETRQPRAYNALIRKITAAIREVDPVHLIYVEAMPEWGPGAKPFPKGAFETLEPTGDERTVYSFHDYAFRLSPRWPNEERDLRDILTRWIPAFRFSIDSRRPIHLGEFGGFEQTDQSVFDNPCAYTMMLDYLRVFDAFGWHWHYYSNRGTVRVRHDGSLQDSYVQEACRDRASLHF